MTLERQLLTDWARMGTRLGCAALISLAPVPLPASDDNQTGLDARSTDLATADIPELPAGFTWPPASAQPSGLLVLQLDGEGSLEHDDNVLRSPSGERSDRHVVVAPRLRLRYQGDEHKALFTARIEGGKYDDITGNDYVDVDLSLRGELAPAHRTQTQYWIRARKDHTPIGGQVDEPDRLAADATQYLRIDTGLRLSHDLGAAFVVATLDGTDYEYENNRRRDGTLILNADRDRLALRGNLRFGLWPDRELRPFVYAGFDRRRYDRDDAGQNYDRNSDGYRAGLGLEFDGPDWSPAGELNAGWVAQNYDEAGLRDVSVFDLGGTLRWQYSPRLQFQGQLSRRIRETQSSGVSAYVETALAARVNYSVSGQTLAYAGLNFVRREFEAPGGPGTGQPARTDDLLVPTIGLTHALTSTVSLDANYRHVNRDSSESDARYRSNLWRVTARVSF